MDVDFGPKPFRFFNIWLDKWDIGQIVENAWKKEVRSRRPDCRLRDKLKNIKNDLRKWSKKRFGALKEKIEGHKKEAMRWELEAENRLLSESETSRWLAERKLWVEKEKELFSMARQKARIKWDVKGDENSKFNLSIRIKKTIKITLEGL